MKQTDNHQAMSKVAKKLILGTIAGLSLDQIKPFFLSLEKTGFSGDLCMVVGDIDSATLGFLRARHVNLVPFQKVYFDPDSWVVSILRTLLARHHVRLLEQFALGYLHMNCARKFFYRSYLESCGFNYDHVMLADIRDIFFQRNPFDFELPDGLSVFMEDPGKTIGTCFTNSTWMRNGFGENVLRDLYHQPISCSGTIFGTPSALLLYLEQVVSILRTYEKQNSIDQATHNFVIYKRTPEALHRFSNDSGIVLTMANVDPSCFQFNEHGLLINHSGLVYNTLHQYDRHPKLMSQLLGTLT